MSPIASILAGGAVAGALDITYACVFWAIKADVPAQRIFQSVAAGLLGEATFEGGMTTAVLGLALHFFIATTMAAAFYLAARARPELVRRPVLTGAIYGVGLYIVMNYIVLPLSAAGSGSKNPLWIWLTVLVHAFFIGVPIALFVRRSVSPQAR